MSTEPKSKRRAMAALRRTIRGIEEAASPEQPRLPLGVSSIDRVLPGGGLRLGCVHEVAGDESATGFCAALLARALAAGRRGGGRPGALLWLARGGDLYAPGLVGFGIGSGQLVVAADLRRRDDMLWAMEETLRCRAVTGVVAETGEVGPAAGRRLMLAAEGTGVLGLLLLRRAFSSSAQLLPARRLGGGGIRTAASRWRVTAAPCRGGVGSGGGTEPRWRVELLHCRGGRRAEWITNPADHVP